MLYISLTFPYTQTMNTPNPILSYIQVAFPATPSSQHGGHNSIGKQHLADAAGVTWATVHKASLGLYSSLPIKLVNYMNSHPVGDQDHSIDSWEAIYQQFIREAMATLKSDIDNGRMEAEALFTAPKDLSKHYNSFITWRQSLSYSQMDFCKTFLLHQAILSKYESGQMKSMPQSLKDRLSFVGMSNEYIHAVGMLPIHQGDK